MPSMPPNPCRYYMCPGHQVDKSGYCAEHKALALREYDSTRNKEINNFYSSKAWGALRDYKLSISPLCEHCLRVKKLEGAVIVHHVEEITPYNRHMWLALDNLESVCFKCHERTKKHGRGTFKTRNK